jgi:hypothetical protein
MERELTALHVKAGELIDPVASISLKDERIRGAKRFKDVSLQEITRFLGEFGSLSESDAFSQKELSEMLANACLEMGSFLFSAGAPTKVWREWCSLAGQSLYLAQDFSYSMQLLTIARVDIDTEALARMENAELKSYREQAIQFVIFRPRGHQPPSFSPVHPLDHHYQSLIESLESGNRPGLIRSIDQVVEFWRNETSYGTFEPGVFPVFEPEINSTVSALIMQGFDLEFREAKVKNFLRAGLESSAGENP